MLRNGCVVGVGVGVGMKSTAAGMPGTVAEGVGVSVFPQAAARNNKASGKINDTTLGIALPSATLRKESLEAS